MSLVQVRVTGIVEPIVGVQCASRAGCEMDWNPEGARIAGIAAAAHRVPLKDVPAAWFLGSNIHPTEGRK